MRRRPLAIAALTLLLGGCLSGRPLEMPALAVAQVSGDFGTYEVRRVGIMPFVGEVPEATARALQLGLFSEMQLSSTFELVVLDPSDLEEVEVSEPFRRGWYRPRTIIDLSKRYKLDAILFGQVTQQRFFPPQLLSLQVEMVAAETGLVIWSSSVHLDATDQRVLDGLQIYYGNGGARRRDGSEVDDWRLALLSPERFARFAAYQIASLL